MEIRVGDKFILHSSDGIGYGLVVENINDHRPPDEKYAVTSSGPAGVYPDFLFYGDDFFEKWKERLEYVGNVNDDYEEEV